MLYDTVSNILFTMPYDTVIQTILYRTVILLYCRIVISFSHFPVILS